MGAKPSGFVIQSINKGVKLTLCCVWKIFYQLRIPNNRKTNVWQWVSYFIGMIKYVWVWSLASKITKSDILLYEYSKLQGNDLVCFKGVQNGAVWNNTSNLHILFDLKPKCIKKTWDFFFVVSTTWLIKYQHLYFHEPACLNWNSLLWHLTVSYRMGKLLALWYTWVCFRNLLNDLHSHWHTADCCLCGELMTDTQLDFFCQNWAFQ